jgi:hypothetical protein
MGMRLHRGMSDDRRAATVDTQIGSVDISRSGASHECDKICHLFRSPEAPGRVVKDLFEHVSLDLVPGIPPPAPFGFEPVELFDSWSNHDAWADSVDGYAALPVSVGTGP